jgi:hypothetical protein
MKKRLKIDLSLYTILQISGGTQACKLFNAPSWVQPGRGAMVVPIIFSAANHLKLYAIKKYKG